MSLKNKNHPSPLKNFLKRSFLSLIIAFLLGTGMSFHGGADHLFSPGKAYAEDITSTLDSLPEPQPAEAKSSEDLVKQVAGLANKTHRLFAPLINIFAFHIGNFLGTDHVYEGAMGKMLQKIWVISRNLVNIAFVFLLLWMALKEIFFVDQESDLRKNLVKLVLLLVVVNFSWLGTKIVLDAANVVTHAVFAIPSGISGDSTLVTQCDVNSDPTKPITGSCYPTAMIAPADSSANNILYWQDKEGEDDACAAVKKGYGGSAGADTNAAYNADGSRNENASPSNKKLQGFTSICVENLNLINYNQNTAVIYLTYGMAKIQNLVDSTHTVKIDDLAISTLLSIIIQIAYTVSLFALFIAMVMRMAILWIFVGFSPFLVLFAWKNGFANEDLGEFKFGLEEFVNWAFVPAKVGAIFVVSFIMISAGQSMGDVDIQLMEKGGQVFKIPEIKTLFGSIGSLQNFIWLLISLVVLWMGVFGILSKMSIVSGVTNWIRDKGIAAGKFIATSPYWAPVLPLGRTGGKQSIRETLAPLAKPFKDLEEMYRPGSIAKGEDVRRLDAIAHKKDFSKYGQKAVDKKIEKSDARTIASEYGFDDIHKMMKMDKDVLMNAFKASKVSEDQRGALYEALLQAEKDMTPIKSAAIKQATKEGQEEAAKVAAADKEAKAQAPVLAPGSPATKGAPPNPQASAPKGGAGTQ